MNWLTIALLIPATLVAVAFARVGWLVAKEMDWLSPIRSDWEDIPISLRIKYQGKAFLLYLIVGSVRSTIFFAAFACGWLARDSRHSPALVCLCLLGFAVCIGLMWTDAQAHYGGALFRGPQPKNLE
jgi:hypothetical protein